MGFFGKIFSSSMICNQKADKTGATAKDLAHLTTEHSTSTVSSHHEHDSSSRCSNSSRRRRSSTRKRDNKAKKAILVSSAAVVVSNKNTNMKKIDEVEKSWGDGLTNEQKKELVKSHLRAWNELRDNEAWIALLTDDATVEINEHNMNPADLASECANLWTAFPDFRLTWKSIEISQEDGHAILKGVTGSGTHTGAPYGCGPCEPIPVTGIRVKNDPETFHYYFRDGKNCKFVIVADGYLTGPMGFYTQIGGFPL